MIETRRLEALPGLVYDVSVAGTDGAPLVLMLHGFAVSRHLYDDQLPPLAAAGYFAAAPNQRGYSPNARPDTTQHALYDIDVLVTDVAAFADALGYAGKRFHLVGHDWGGSIAWQFADRYPERLASLTILSRPHPLSFTRAMKEDPEQARRSGHHKWFLSPTAADEVLADDVKWLRTRHAANGTPPGRSAQHIAVLGNKGAMEAALAWYRARGTVYRPIGPIKVPTLYIWGDADDTVGRMGAEGTKDFIDAPYQFAVLPGVGHFAADQQPERVAELLLAHLAAHPV